MRTILLTPLLALATTLAVNAEPMSARVLDHRVLPEIDVNGETMAELSGLAYDPQTQTVYAVSDRATLFSLAFSTDGETITALEPQAAAALTDADGNALAEQGFGPEALMLRPDETGALNFAILSESGPRAALFKRDGGWLAEIDLPSAVRDSSRQAGKNRGLESIAHHPELGLVTLPEEPFEPAQRTAHTLYAEGGETLSWSSEDIGASRVKAMTALPDGRLLVLERIKEDKALVPYLRLVDPAVCAADTLCKTQAVRLDVPGIDDADFEGIVAVSPSLFLLVSDDRIKKEQRSVFALVDVTFPAMP